MVSLFLELVFHLSFVTFSITVRKDEINNLIESKFDVLKNAFVKKLKNYSLKKWRMNWKNYSLKNLKKIKSNSLLKPTKRWKSQRQRCLRSMLKTWSVQMRNSKKMRRTWTIRSTFMSKNKRFDEKTKKMQRCIKSGKWSF